MENLLNYPLVVAVVMFILTWGAAHLGVRLGRFRRLAPKEVEDFNLVLGATLTLLGLIVGFAFSMAVARRSLLTGAKPSRVP